MSLIIKIDGLDVSVATTNGDLYAEDNDGVVVFERCGGEAEQLDSVAAMRDAFSSMKEAYIEAVHYANAEREKNRRLKSLINRFFGGEINVKH